MQVLLLILSITMVLLFTLLVVASMRFQNNHDKHRHHRRREGYSGKNYGMNSGCNCNSGNCIRMMDNFSYEYYNGEMPMQHPNLGYHVTNQKLQGATIVHGKTVGEEAVQILRNSHPKSIPSPM